MKCFGHCFKCGPLVINQGYGRPEVIEFENFNSAFMRLPGGRSIISQLDVLYEETSVGVQGNPGPYYLYFQNENIIQVTVRSNGKELPMRRLSEKPAPSSDPKLIRAGSYPEFAFQGGEDDLELELDCKCRDESDDFIAKIHITFKNSGSYARYNLGDVLHQQCNTGFSFGMVSFNWPKGVDRTVVSLYLTGRNGNQQILNKIDEISVTDKNQRKVLFMNLPFGEYCYVVRQYSSNGTIYSMTNYETMIVKNFVGTVC
jgi:hypothetical protein